MTLSGPLKIWTFSDFVFFGAAKKTRSHIDICCEAGIENILSFMSSWKNQQDKVNSADSAFILLII